jgi:hypothetical protein
MSQTSYSNEPSAGVVGALVGTDNDVDGTYIAEGAVRPGQYVIFDAATKKCKHPSAAPTANTRFGVAIRKAYGQSDGVYADGDPVNVLTRGRIRITSENALAINANVFVRHVAAGAEELGAFRSDADTSDATAVPGLYVREAGTTNIVLEVNRA